MKSALCGVDLPSETVLRGLGEGETMLRGLGEGETTLCGVGDGEIDSPIETTLCVLPHEASCAPTELQFLVVEDRMWDEM